LISFDPVSDVVIAFFPGDLTRVAKYFPDNGAKKKVD
jgi:hypothetical protein